MNYDKHDYRIPAAVEYFAQVVRWDQHHKRWHYSDRDVCHFEEVDLAIAQQVADHWNKQWDNSQIAVNLRGLIKIFPIASDFNV